jgi:hypothetical protein
MLKERGLKARGPHPLANDIPAPGPVYSPLSLSLLPFPPVYGRGARPAYGCLTIAFGGSVGAKPGPLPVG